MGKIIKMGKMVIKKEDLKSRNRVCFRDKETNEHKGSAETLTDGSIKISESNLKYSNIHILDKVSVVKKDDKEEEIGIVNDFYTEPNENDKKTSKK